MGTLPGGCWICREWQGERLCAACVARFAAPRPRCPRCALPADDGCGPCLREPLPLDSVHAAVDYAPPWDALILRWKDQGALGLTPAFAALLARCAQAPADALFLPVPLHAQRLRERGYSPPVLLAQALRRPMRVDALLRVIDTPPQRSLNRQERLRNLKQAFALAPGVPVAGRSCVLVDDVMTTGATLATLADLLRRAGAARVDAWVIARTEAPD